MQVTKAPPGKNTIRDRRDHQSRCCREGHDGRAKDAPSAQTSSADTSENGSL